MDYSSVSFTAFKDEARDLIDKNKVILLRRDKLPEDFGTASQARNFGLNYILENSENEALKNIKYLVFLDSDDEILDISNRAKLFEKKPKTAMVTTSIERVHNFNSAQITEIQKGLSDRSSTKRIWRDVYTKGYPYVSTMWNWEFMKLLYKSLDKVGGDFGLFDNNIIYGEDRGVIWLGFKFAIKNNFNVTNDPNIVSYRYYWNDDSESVKVDKDPKQVERLRRDHKYLANTYLSKKEKLYRFFYKKVLKKFINAK